MADRTWLTVEEAAERLGVKPETVYAYVSRAVLRSERVPGERRSRILRADVERHAERSRRGRVRQGLELVIETAVCALDPDGALAYRGIDVGELCARPGTRFEAVAEWLWTGRWPDRPPSVPGRGAGWSGDPRPVDGAIGATPLVDRWRSVLAVARAADPLRGDRRPASVAATGRAVLATLLDAAPLLGHEPRSMPDEQPAPVAARLWPRLTSAPPSDRRIRVLDTALVLLADHELATSTLAARVTASTWADPYLVVQAGLAALGGPLHGGAGAQARRVLAAAADHDDPAAGAAAVIGRHLAEDRPLPGTGHSVYVAVDPRFGLLLDALDGAGDTPPAVTAIVDLAAARSLPAPNVDLALAGVAEAYDMVPDATEAVFALARTVGWLAHAIEEYEHRLRYRARAAYVGDRAAPGGHPGALS